MMVQNRRRRRLIHHQQQKKQYSSHSCSYQRYVYILFIYSCTTFVIVYIQSTVHIIPVIVASSSSSTSSSTASLGKQQQQKQLKKAKKKSNQQNYDRATNNILYKDTCEIPQPQKVRHRQKPSYSSSSLSTTTTTRVTGYGSIRHKAIDIDPIDRRKNNIDDNNSDDSKLYKTKQCSIRLIRSIQSGEKQQSEEYPSRSTKRPSTTVEAIEMLTIQQQQATTTANELSSSSSVSSSSSSSSIRLAVVVPDEKGKLKSFRDDIQLLITNNNHTTASNDDDPNNILLLPKEAWYPVEGLFGVYTIPSGRIYVWIVQSEIVYEAPVMVDEANKATTSPTTTTTSWWTIRKITQLHLVRVVPTTNTKSNSNNAFADRNTNNNSSNNSTSSSTNTNTNHNYYLKESNNPEEKRQIKLLRQALKHHEWYYCTRNDYYGDGTCNELLLSIPDMTNNLQQSVLVAQRQQQERIQQQRLLYEKQQQQQQSTKKSWFSLKNVMSSNQANATYDNNNVSTILPWWDIVPPTNSSSLSTCSSNTNNSNNADKNNSDRVLPVVVGGTYDTKFYQQEQRPDSRFFWNEEVYEPFVQLLHETYDNILHKQQQQHSNLDCTNDWNIIQALRIVLNNMIPVTSAFVGVQSNLSPLSSSTTSTTSQATIIDSSSTGKPTYYYDEVLISRRSKYRAGTRFTRRGADATGAVANYAETEQLLFVWNPLITESSRVSNAKRRSTKHNRALGNYNNYFKNLTAVVSHVQIRGSIPLRWSSPTDIKTYRPRIRIGTDPIAQARALFLHLADQAKRYCIVLPTPSTRKDSDNLDTNKVIDHPSLVLVNLIDKTGDQGRLGRALDAVLKAVVDVYSTQLSGDEDGYEWLRPSRIQHVWFDFHAEVKSGRWDKLSTLLQQVRPSLLGHGYFRALPSPVDTNENGEIDSGISSRNNNNNNFPLRIEKLQSGVVRTNCMDCLDRTNVVQSIFGRYMLFQQIIDLERNFKIPLTSKVAFRQTPMTIPWVSGEYAHRLLWADNADAISRLYAGTPALKGDFTRTGKRTKKGALDDGMNSLQRYYLNNFLDADRQEGIDLLVGQSSFNNIGETDDTTFNDDAMKKGEEAALFRQGMSVKEAARYMLLGIDDDTDTNSRKDIDHMRIKFNTRTRQKWSKMLRTKGNQPVLDLRWLPGDLQDQFRVSTFYGPTTMDSNNNNNQLVHPDYWAAADVLEAIDRRATSDVPWWVIDDEESSSIVQQTQQQPNKNLNPIVTTANAGFVLSALLAGTQAPTLMAAIVLSLVAITFLPLDDLDD